MRPTSPLDCELASACSPSAAGWGSPSAAGWGSSREAERLRAESGGGPSRSLPGERAEPKLHSDCAGAGAGWCPRATPLPQGALPPLPQALEKAAAQR